MRGCGSPSTPLTDDQCAARDSTFTKARVSTDGFVTPGQLETIAVSRLPSRAPQDVAAAVCTTEPERPSAAVTRPTEPGGDPTRRRRRDAASGHPAATGATTARQLSRQLRGDLGPGHREDESRRRGVAESR